MFLKNNKIVIFTKNKLPFLAIICTTILIYNANAHEIDGKILAGGLAFIYYLAGIEKGKRKKNE